MVNVKGDDDAGIEGSNTLRRSSQKRILDIAETESIIGIPKVGRKCS